MRTGSTGLGSLLSARSCCNSCESGDYILSTCLDQFCWDVVKSSWLPFLQWLYCSLHFFAKDGWSYSVSVWGQLGAVFCPSVQYLFFFCEAFSWMILDSSSFPLFHCGQVFHKLVCPLTWQCSQCPSEVKIQCHAHVYSLFYWRKPCVLTLLLFCQSSSILFQSPRVFHLYLSMSCVSSWSFPTAPVSYTHLRAHET